MRRPGLDERGARTRTGARRPVFALIVLAVGLGGLAALPASAAETERRHPRLVSAAAARCATCHGTLIESKKTVHAATKDCTSCHQVELGAAGTTITLATAEPGLCLSCHQELEVATKGTLAAPHPPATESCSTCHSPHASDQPRLLLDAQSALCGSCHDAEALKPGHGGQLTAATHCTACHAPHGSAHAKLLAGGKLHAPFADGTCGACHREPFGGRIRLQARGQRLCLACHEDPTEAPGPRFSVHPAMTDDAKGRASCLACHSPHLSEQPKLLLGTGPALCGTCHAAILAAARAESGHPPAAEDCTSCHLPHAAAEPRLLRVAKRELCAECHDLADPRLAGKHLGANLTALECLACHSPHGEGNPKLLAEHVHPPVLEGCDACHEGAFDKLVEAGNAPLCLACHAEIGEAAAKAAVPHAALEMGPCTQCHNPHAAARAKLVKALSGAECTACHTEQAAGAGEVAHGVIDLIGCEACHEPHGGARSKLLRMKGAELCLACHGPLASRPESGASSVQLLGRFTVTAASAAAIVRLDLSPDGLRNHPATGHRVLGTPSAAELERAATSFRGELTCLSCHDPHKGKSARLFRWNAASASEACQHCHAK